MEGEKEVLEEDEDYDEEGKMRIVEQNTKSLSRLASRRVGIVRTNIKLNNNI